MSSGLDVYLEKLNGEPLPEFPVARVYTETKGNKLDTPHEVTYYCRVNGDKITWGYMAQIDDNLKIIYNKNNKTFQVIEL